MAAVTRLRIPAVYAGRAVSSSATEELAGNGVGVYVPIPALAYVLGPRVHEVLRRYGAIAGVSIVVLLVLYFVL